MCFEPCFALFSNISKLGKTTNSPTQSQELYELYFPYDKRDQGVDKILQDHLEEVFGDELKVGVINLYLKRHEWEKNLVAAIWVEGADKGDVLMKLQNLPPLALPGRVLPKKLLLAKPVMIGKILYCLYFVDFLSYVFLCKAHITKKSEKVKVEKEKAELSETEKAKEVGTRLVTYVTA